MPDHVAFYVVSDAVFAAKEESFVGEDRLIAGWNGASVDGFGIGAYGTQCQRFRTVDVQYLYLQVQVGLLEGYGVLVL